MADPYRLATPEQVELEYDLAGIGSRFVAALVDVTIQGVLILVLFVGLIGGAALMAAITRDTALSETAATVVGIAGVSLYILLNFVVVWGYYPFFEVIWGGQTPGKRVVGVRVVRLDGGPIGFVEALVRNVVRVADFLPAWYALGTVVMLLNQRSRRLGDLAAGTLVIKERRDITLALLAAPAARASNPTESPAAEQSLNWAALGPRDYVLVREFLLRRDTLPAGRRRELAERIARGLAGKLGEPPPERVEPFLERVAGEYRRR
jgi:uncharacterized RDD family membrane protein YckC